MVYTKRHGAGTPVVIHRDWIKKWEKLEAADFAGSCLGQWLRYEGPIPISRIESIFGLSGVEAKNTVRDLIEQGELVSDVTVEESKASSLYSSGSFSPLVFTGTNLICDRENLELMLRLGRRKQRPQVKERPAPVLVPFLALRQGLYMSSPGKATEAVTSIPSSSVISAGPTRAAENMPWERLTGIAMPAKLWETEIFLCRCPSYSGDMLDREIMEGKLLWYGTGKEKAAFCAPDDMDLIIPLDSASSRPLLFSGKLENGFFDTLRNFWEIKEALAAGDSGIGSVTEALWEEVWKGNLSSDSWEPLRKALEIGFTSAESSMNARLAGSGDHPGMGSSVIGRRSLRVPRALRERWRSGPPVRGNWFSLSGDGLGPEKADILEEDELNRERVRLLLGRWGILARPLLERESSALLWSKLLPTIRRMELAGELVTGRFFDGVNSLQFATPRIAEELEKADTALGIYWMNAADPASPAGLTIQGIISTNKSTYGSDPVIIRRLPSTRLCFRDSELIAISNKGGREIEIFIPPDDPDIAGGLAFIKFPRVRRIQPEMKIVIEKINGSSAARSPYSSILVDTGFVKDRGKLILWQ